MYTGKGRPRLLQVSLKAEEEIGAIKLKVEYGQEDRYHKDGLHVLKTGLY